jgi:hypothetical protein
MNDEERLLLAIRLAQSSTECIAIFGGFGATEDQVERARINAKLVKQTVQAFRHRRQRASPLAGETAIERVGRAISPDKWDLLADLVKVVFARRRVSIDALQKMDARRKTLKTAIAATT